MNYIKENSTRMTFTFINIQCLQCFANDLFLLGNSISERMCFDSFESIRTTVVITLFQNLEFLKRSNFQIYLVINMW